MKSKRLFQIFVLLTVLFSPFGNHPQVYASTSSTDQPYIQVVDHNLTNWGPNYSYTGRVSSSVYDNWRFTLPEDRKFTMKVTSVVGDLVPLLILLDANGHELTRDLYTLTNTQPAGDYSIRVQPQSGEGILITLRLRKSFRTSQLYLLLLVHPVSIWVRPQR